MAQITNPQTTIDQIGVTLAGPLARVVFGRRIRDDSWSLVGGRIQHLSLLTTIKSIELDFEKAAWADPFPLLSLAALIAFAKRHRPDLSVRLNLGSPRNSDDDRFLLFVASQGFLRILTKNCEVIWKDQAFSLTSISQLEDELQRLQIIPAYTNADCIKAKLIPIEEITKANISEFVDGLVSEAEKDRVNRWLSGNSRQRGFLLYKLRQLLAESLDNILEHAYPEADGFGAIFARIRTGTPEDVDDFRTWNTARVGERRHCPTLNRNNFARQPGWLELFVCDVGCGLTTHLTTDTKAPLFSLGNKLFRDPLSKQTNRDGVGKTRLTGLQHIGLLLQNRAQQDRGDFVRVYSSGEWLGDHLPWPPAELRAAHRNFRSETPQILTGTGLHFAIEPSPAGIEEQLLLYPKFFFQPKYDDLVAIRTSLESPQGPLFQPTHYFIDLEAKGGEPEAGRGERIRRLASEINAASLIIRPSRATRKADLLDQIILIRRHAKVPVHKIIFADVPASSAIDFALILQQDRLPLDAQGDLSIFILTRDWLCAGFRLDETTGALSASQESAANFLALPPEEIGGAFVAEVLREKDSLRFWSEIGDAYLNEPVVWTSSAGAKLDIVGYVDLPIAMSQPKAFDSARRAVRRAVSSFAQRNVITSDSLASSLIGDEFLVFDGTKPLAKDNAPKKSVALGSVLVSGSTSQRLSARIDVSIIGRVHLLRHPEGNAKTQSALALLWLPPATPRKRPRRKFERIAESPFMVRGGEGAIPLPRFDTPKNGQLGPSLYGDSPNEMYERWQRLNLLRMGHWTYSRHHDLLTINLADALQYELGDSGRIVPWMIQVLSDWKRTCDETSHASLVVYPRNRVTDILARILLERAADAIPFLFPLQQIHTSSVSPLMISLTERERLGQRLRRDFKRGGLVIQLDDGVLSGRTMDQLQQVIEGLWDVLQEAGSIPRAANLEIRSLAIVDRSGNPTQRGLVRKKMKTAPRLWRWDVPTLGQEGACPLCITLNRCRDLATHLSNEPLRRRLIQWIDTWSPLPVDEMGLGRGLMPMPVPSGDFTRFGIERLPDGVEISHRVQHLSSTSRAAIAMEICRSTTRKDYPFQKAQIGRFKNGEGMDIQTRIEILAAQIFLFREELSFVERIERLNVMVDLLWASENTTPATALAGLSLLLDPATASTTWLHIAEKVEQEEFPNDDTLILAFLVHELQSGTPAPKSTHKNWTLFQLLISSAPLIRESLRRVFQVFGWDRRSIHSGLLLDLLKKTPLKAKDLTQIVLMLEALADALRSLTPEMIGTFDLASAADANALLSFVDRIRQTGDRLVAADKLIPDVSFTLAADTYLGDSNVRQEIRSVLDDAYDKLFVRADSLQHKYKDALTVEISANVRPNLILEQAVHELDKKWKTHIESKEEEELRLRWTDRTPEFGYATLHSPIKPLLAYHDAMVDTAIVEALSNVIHSTGKITCPWSSYGDKVTEADMWGRLVVGGDSTFVVIELANSADQSMQLRHPRQTVNTVHLGNIGGSVTHRYDTQRGVFYTKIKLPTLAGLAWQEVSDDEVSDFDY